MAATLEARKKAGPFMPRWQKVKGRHKALSGKLFKPDIGSVIERYDQTLKDYDEKLKEQEKLRAVIVELVKTGEESATEIADLTGQLTQLTKKWRESNSKATENLSSYAKGSVGKIADIKSDLGNVISGAEEYINKRKQLWTDIDGVAYINLNKFKKAQADYGAMASSAESEMSKIENDANSAESEIMGILRGYAGIADDADHPEITKDLQSLKV